MKESAGPAKGELERAHAHFSADCFHRAWELLERADRSRADTHEMIALAHASYWHWSRRPDFEGKRPSVSFWQLSRVYAVAGHAALAREFAERCHEASAGLKPFYQAYACEARARAASVAGDRDARDRFAAEGRRLAADIESHEERAMVLRDLDSLG